MFSRSTIYIIILALVLPIIVDGRICRQKCNCHSVHSKADKALNKLNEINKANDELLRKNIDLNSDFAMRVSNNGNTVGYIYDEYKPSMTIPPNSQIQVVQKKMTNNNYENYIRVFYDVGNNGLFTDLSIPGNYKANQISLPSKSISSITIPKGFQVILYAEDNFQGDHIVLSDSSADLQKFNDRTQSIEIINQFSKKPEHLAVAYSHQQHAGKQLGLVIGNNKLSNSQIKSIMIDVDYEVLIYSDDILIDIIRSKESIFGSTQIRSPNTILNAVVQKISEHLDKYIVFYEDIDFKGPHFIVIGNSTSSIYYADGKLSSIRIHPDYEVVLYDQTNLQGTYIVVSDDINNLNFYAFNDRAMSITVRPKNDKECSENVKIYTKSYYNGESMIVPIGRSECSVNKLLDFCDNTYAGSIKVPMGFRVTIIKKTIPIIGNERVYIYTKDTPNINNYFDTLITSVIVEKI